MALTWVVDFGLRATWTMFGAAGWVGNTSGTVPDSAYSITRQPAAGVGGMTRGIKTAHSGYFRTPVFPTGTMADGIIQIHFYMDGTGKVQTSTRWDILDSSDNVLIRIRPASDNTTTTWRVYRGTSSLLGVHSTTTTINAWNTLTIRFKPGTSDGELAVSFNGTSQVFVATGNTGGTTAWAKLEYGHAQKSGGNRQGLATGLTLWSSASDDALTKTYWVGSGLVPTSDSSTTGWTSTAGTFYTEVDDPASKDVDTADYVSATAASSTILFGTSRAGISDVFSPTAIAGIAVALSGRAAVTNDDIRMLTSSSGTSAESIDHPMNGSISTPGYAVFTTDPSTSAVWTVEGFSSMLLGAITQETGQRIDAMVASVVWSGEGIRAAEVKSKRFPVAPDKKYRWTCEWQASSITSGNTLTIKVHYLNGSKAVVSTYTVYADEAEVVDTWQVNTGRLAPPTDARFAQFSLIKAADTAYKIAVDRITLDEVRETGMDGLRRGVILFDDMVSADFPESSLNWEATTIAQAPTYTHAPAASGSYGSWSELGVGQIVTDAVANTGANIHTGDVGYGVPPTGTYFAIKCKITANSPLVWAGLFDQDNTFPDAGISNTIRGIGVRYITGTWYGFTRDASNETTVNLGISATVWRSLGFYIDHSGHIQFVVNGNAVGSPISTYLPSTQTLIMQYGVVTLASLTATLQIDYIGIRGSFDRQL